MTATYATYRVTCQWKGREATFSVAAVDYATACDAARAECKRKAKMPPSSVRYVRYVGDVPPVIDSGIRRRAEEKIIHDRRV